MTTFKDVQNTQQDIQTRQRNAAQFLETLIQEVDGRAQGDGGAFRAQNALPAVTRGPQP